MTRRRYYSIQLFFIIYITAYLTSTIYESTFWGDILSPIGALAAFVILLKAFSITEQPKLCWLFPALACLSWAAADILWAVYELLLGINPENMIIFTALYLLSNIFMALSLYAFFITQKNVWYSFQKALDILAISAALLTMMWTVFLNKQFELFSALNTYNALSFLYLLSDFFILGCVLVWYIHLRRGQTPVIAKLAFTSLTCFAICGLACSYLINNSLYVPNSIMDAGYILSLLIFAQGGLWEIFKPQGPMENDVEITSGYRGSRRNGYILLLAPLIVMAIHRLNFASFLVFLTIILLYQFLSSHIQFSINNEHLLAKEKAMNTILEERIAERTQELHKINQYLDIQARQDTITKLLNRRHIFDTLDQMLEEIEPGDSIFILYIDLDRFKTINDSYGHDIGDQVLMEIANRLDNCNQYNALLARVGGDEFVFVLPGPYQANDIVKITTEVIHSCNEPIIIPPYHLHVSLSIGITKYPEDASERSDLMRNADIAMYYAKSQGFNKYIFYSTLEPKIHKKNIIELKLKEADYDKEFEVLYQPLFRIADNALIGMEALLRWHNSELGPVFPDEFIPVAEESGVIIALGQWVMEKAIGQIAQWNKMYDMQLKMGVNISPRQLESLDLIEFLKQSMMEYDIPPQWLDIEITENIAMKGETCMEEIFTLISGLGLSISIDDFGTGYSSLSYLKHYSFDRLKIAKPLVDNVTTDINDVQIIKAIIMIGKALGIKTIAEGVEYEAQLEILAGLGCDEAQGYLFSCPLPASQFEKLFLQRVSSAG